jgi:hypothetical protein
MKKSDRIEAELGGPHAGHVEQHPGYTGWFEHFNAARYYEAHDVLEHVWLQTTGENQAFFKGLIQLAGAFVHLKKQFERPTHPKDGKRLRPAVRLLRLAEKNLAPSAPRHLRLDVAEVLEFCGRWAAEIERGGFARNPWRPEELPRVELGER